MDTDIVQNGSSLFPAFQGEVGHAVVHRQGTGLVAHIDGHRVVDGTHAHAAPHRELFRLAVGQDARLIAVGAVVDVLQRAGTGDHQRHVAVDQHARGHRLACMGGGNGADVAVFRLGQDEHRAKAVVRVELRRHLIGDVQAKAAGHGQAPAEPQVGDVAHLIARKACILGGRDAAGGVLFQLAEHDPGQLQERLAPPLAGDTVGLRDGQDQIFHAGKSLFRHLIPALEPGTEGPVGRQGALGQRLQLHILHRPGAQHLPLFEQGVQRLPAQLVHGAAGHEPGALVHLHLDVFRCKGGAARLGEAPLQALGGVGAGGLRLKIAVGKRLVAVGVSHGQLLAALFDFQLHPHGHPGALPAVELPQGGQGLFGQFGVGLTADTKHRAVDLPVQIAGGEAGAAERIFQQVTVIGTALPACQTGADRRRHILRRAQAAFDLGRGHTDGLQLVQFVDDGVVFQGKVVQPPGLALGQGVGLKGQAAGACTGAAVAAPSAQKRRQIALAADAHAECAMDEALRLNAAVPGDLLHLRQAQLTGQHHPGKAQLLELQRPLQGVDTHLGGAMAGQLGCDLPNEGGHGQILADDRIRPAGGHRPDGIAQRGQFPAVHGGVEGHMDLDAPGVAEADGLFQAVGIKISGARAGVEAGKAQINRICSAEYGGVQHFFTAHRGKDLNICHNSPFDGMLLYLLNRIDLRAVPQLPASALAACSRAAASFILACSFASCSRRAAFSR